MNNPNYKTENLLGELSSRVEVELSPELQAELAELVRICHDIDRSDDPCLLATVELAARALLANPANVALAKAIRKGVEKRLNRYRNPFRAAFFGESPASTVILGLSTLFYIVFPLAIVLVPRIIAHDDIFGMKISMLLLVAISGALGSIVSILVRVQALGSFPCSETPILFFIGLFKPIVGTCFALLVFAILKAGLIPVTINPATEQYFFIALSFAAGFSERFASDIMSEVETNITAVK